MPWLCICLLFGPIGSAVYFFTQYLPQALPARAQAPRGPKVNLDHLGAEARRLDKSELWSDYAKALRAKRRSSEAAEAASRAIELDGDNLRAWSELGLALLGAGRPDEAVKPLSTLTAREPYFDHGEALYSLAQAQEAAGDSTAAKRSMETLTERHPRSMFVYALGVLQAKGGDVESARASFEGVIDDARMAPRYAQREANRWARKAKRLLRRL